MFVQISKFGRSTFFWQNSGTSPLETDWSTTRHMKEVCTIFHIWQTFYGVLYILKQDLCVGTGGPPVSRSQALKSLLARKALKIRAPGANSSTAQWIADLGGQLAVKGDMDDIARGAPPPVIPRAMEGVANAPLPSSITLEPLAGLFAGRNGRQRWTRSPRRAEYTRSSPPRLSESSSDAPTDKHPPQQSPRQFSFSSRACAMCFFSLFGPNYFMGRTCSGSLGSIVAKENF